MSSRMPSVEELDRKIEALKKKRSEAIREHKKRTLAERKARQIEARRILYEAMSEYLHVVKNLSEDRIIELGAEELKAIIFEKQ